MKFDTSQNIILENDRVRLTPLTKAHFKTLLPFSENEPELWTYSLVSGSGSENLKKYMDHALQKRDAGDSYPFLVFDKATQQYAGSTRFYDIQQQHNTLQLGYTWYGKDFQRTGLNKHCKFLLLSYAFETLNVARVEFRADANNARSIAAMKRIGCTVEGVLRSNCASPAGRRDSIVLSILKNEWDNNKKGQLKTQLQ